MFSSFKLNKEGIEAVNLFKSTLADATRSVMDLMPEGREKALFQTKMEEASFFGTRAISSRQSNNEGNTEY